MFENALEMVTVSIVELYQGIKNKVKLYQDFQGEGKLHELMSHQETEAFLATSMDEEERNKLAQMSPIVLIGYIKSTVDILLSPKVEEDV